MKATPSVSVAIPVYNGERYLGAALDCVREQDLDDLEIIVTDNASTDGTEEIAREAARADSRVRVFRAEHNAGAARNFNWAFEESRGQYFKWLASDDLIEPTLLSDCRAVLADDPTVVLAYPRTVDIGPDAEVLHRWGPMPVAHSPDPAVRFSQILTDPKRGFPVFGLARREQLERTSLIGPFTGSDLILLAELSVMGRFCEVPGELFLHREHDDRSTRAYTDLQERTLWFDTSASAKWSHPYWAQYRGYALALTKGDLSAKDMARCSKALAVWGKKYHRYLGHEVKTTAKHLLGLVTNRD